MCFKLSDQLDRIKFETMDNYKAIVDTMVNAAENRNNTCTVDGELMKKNSDLYYYLIKQGISIDCDLFSKHDATKTPSKWILRWM